MLIRILTLLCFCCCLSCNTNSKLTGQPSQPTHSPTNTEPTIGFFSFSIYKQGDATRVKLIGSKEAKGLIKDSEIYIKNPSATLTADFFDHEEQVASVTVDHPLHLVSEIPEEHKSAMEPIHSDKDSSTFFVRLQLTKKITSIQFSETINKKQNQLNTIKL